jgi:molybdopterin-dependent oxidoreductase alpha subunit
VSGNFFDRRTGPYRAIARAMWDNRDQPAYAWRILNNGVCDGCALGTSGMRDWTIEGIHLCWIRLSLLKLNTMAAFPETVAADCDRLGLLSERRLRSLGRIPHPLIRRRGDSGFSRLSWDEALDLAGDRLRSVDPERLAFYMVARGTLNETYYVAQKVARFLGTNHIDNSARVCHSPSTLGLKRTVGFAATTCSYKDLLESDLIVLFGSDIANNQPVAVKYLEQAKSRGAQVVVVNPYREPGLEKYWVPSSLKSALVGTKIADAFFQVQVGGDIAFIHGVLKCVESHGWLDEDFVKQRTSGWAELSTVLAEQSFEELETLSGVTRQEMLAFARSYARAEKAILIWSMGITMHRHGVANVSSIANLALARGMVGRPGTGLMAIRGHSGVQGGAEMGCVPNQLPGGIPLAAASAQELGHHWGFEVPDWRGYFVSEMVEAAADGDLDVLYCAGSNLLGVLPEPEFVRGALANIPLRIHHDIVLNPQMLVDPGEAVLVLPATTRYEVAGGSPVAGSRRHGTSGACSLIWPVERGRVWNGSAPSRIPVRSGARWKRSCPSTGESGISSKKAISFNGAGGYLPAMGASDFPTGALGSPRWSYHRPLKPTAGSGSTPGVACSSTAWSSRNGTCCLVPSAMRSCCPQRTANVSNYEWAKR